MPSRRSRATLRVSGYRDTIAKPVRFVADRVETLVVAGY